MGLILAPQAREATTAISIPVPGSYSGIMGSHRAEDGNHGRCCMVIGGHSRWGRAVVAHFGWFLRVCVYVVFCGQQFLARPTLPTMFKIDIGSAKMANFCARKEKNASPNHTNIKACTKFSWCEDFSDVLTFGQNGCFGCCILSAQKCAKIYLLDYLAICFKNVPWFFLGR